MNDWIRKLTKKEFGKVEALFAPLDEHLAVRSILVGLSPAEVYVDNNENPKTALTWFKRRIPRFHSTIRCIAIALPLGIFVSTRKVPNTPCIRSPNSVSWK